MMRKYHWVSDYLIPQYQNDINHYAFVKAVKDIEMKLTEYGLDFANETGMTEQMETIRKYARGVL